MQDGVFTGRATADTTSVVLLVSVPILTFVMIILANQMVVRVGRQIAAASFSGVLGCFVMLALGAGIGEMRNLVGFSALMIRPLAAAGLVMSHLLLVEVMPTIARGSALGLCYTVANVGRFGTLLTFEAMR